MVTSVRNEGIVLTVKLISSPEKIITVTDGEVEECVDPRGNGAILNMGEGGGPGPPRGEGNGQLESDSGGG
jgi:hypothetical protein